MPEFYAASPAGSGVEYFRFQSKSERDEWVSGGIHRRAILAKDCPLVTGQKTPGVYVRWGGIGGKPHGNTGNQNAHKGHDTHLNIRVPVESKAAWVKAAAGRPLTEWVIEKLDAAAE